MNNQLPSPPTVAKRPKTLVQHSHTREDLYFWLREKENTEVIDYIKQENAYTQTMMAHTAALQQELYEELVGRIQETDETVPVKKGDYFYYTRTTEGLQYRIYCRKKGGLNAAEEILLDPNPLAEGHDYFRVGLYQVSPNHQLLAYSTDTLGNEEYTIYFKDLTTGELLPDQIKKTMTSAAWAADNHTFFYTTMDDAWRSDKIWRHTLGSNPTAAKLIFHEPDALFDVKIFRTKDDAYLQTQISSIESSEVHILPADTPTAEWQLIHPRQAKLLYRLTHHNGTFYITTNEDAPNFKVMKVAADRPQKENWQPYIPHSSEHYIRYTEAFANHLAISERYNGLATIRIIDLTTEEQHHISAAEPVFTMYIAGNPKFNTTTLRYTYSSLTTPATTYDYDMVNRTQELKKQQPVLGGYDPQNYRSERLWATADDGTKVPLSIVYHKDTIINPDTPCLLYGYGSYGANTEPYFQSNRISFLDRGFIYALAHIRGGGEMGRHWYENGKYLHKKNTFTDFIACAKHLIAENYTSPDKLAIMGRSAGGLLMGAVLNMAPEQFKTAVAGVPFVDVITTMLDESIPLTVGEFEEWGNPKNEEYYHYILSYSPYDNIAAKPYPNILATSGLNDPRVQYWEPTKWVAKLRTLKTDQNLLLLKTNMGAGHGGASGRYDYLKEVAFEYAFVLTTVNS